MTRWLFVTLVSGALLFGACSSPSTIADAASPPDTGDGGRSDTVAEVTIQPGEIVSEPDALFDLFEEDVDVAADPPLPMCEPGDGCILDHCEENGDCQSGWCVQHLGDGVCSQICQEECPPGMSCQQVAGTAPDLVFICVSDFANLCRPCAANADCTSVGGAADACISYGDEGSFCGGGCGEDGDCPWGFSCLEVESVDGVPLVQCVADAGTCPCTGSSIARGLSTPCRVTNAFGICEGMRSCTPDGLSECSASVPAKEDCNGSDDDCDGEVDEPDLVEGAYVLLCDDSNPCTEDSCSGKEGCVNEVLDGTSCDDLDPCTVADHCVAGSCEGEAVECDDGNPCTEDSCTAKGGCVHVPNALPCDDEDPCTVGDLCAEATCSGTPVGCDCVADADCAALEDGNACNGTLVCDTTALPYQCVVDQETVVECPAPEGPEAFCLAAACDPGDGECSLVPANEGVLCDNGDACTYGDTCQAGVCSGGQPVNCNDGNPCTVDACDPAAGCSHTPEPAACDDGNPCTIDSCDPATGCAHADSNEQCDDQNACTLNDQCIAGTCVGGPPPDCDDGNLCTTDSCSTKDGCIHSVNSAPCNDGDVCTVNDQCQLGQCQGGQSLVCNDGNGCTDDSCHPVNGCVFVANDAPCDDGDACTTGDHCAGGWCKPDAFVQCDDGNPCTSSSCAPGVGCVSTLIDGPCDDGDACTVGDACVGGQCVGGKPLLCDDSNPCTNDSCDPQQGCQFQANQAPCNDGDVCTVDDTCSGGECSGLSCSDLGQSCGPVGCIPPVAVDAIDPAEAYPESNVNGTITGSGFLAGASVHFDDEQIPVLNVSDTAIAILIPAGLEPGLYDVKVTNPDGQSDTLESGFTVLLDPEGLGFVWLASKQLWYKEVYVPWSEWKGQYANLEYAHRATSGDINTLASAGLFQNGVNGWTTTECYDQDWGTGGRTWIWWQGSVLWANNCYPYPGAPQKGHLIWDWVPQ